MKQPYDLRIPCVIIFLSFLLGHSAYAYFGSLDDGTGLAGIRRAERGNFRDEVK